MANRVVESGPTRRAGPRAALAIGVAFALVAAGCGADESPESRADRARGPSPAAVSSAADGRGAPAPNGDRLLSRLRSGGTAIVIRHAATDRSMPDREPVDLDDCSTQRNLTAAGRADARMIGATLRELRIPVGTVWTSPYCRARDTARLAFGRADVVAGLERLYPERDEAADRRLNRLIRERAPATGDRNMVIAGHGVYPSALAPAVTLAEGEAAVYTVRPDGVALLGTVAPGEWADLGEHPRGRGDGPH